MTKICTGFPVKCTLMHEIYSIHSNWQLKLKPPGKATPKSYKNHPVRQEELVLPTSSKKKNLSKIIRHEGQLDYVTFNTKTLVTFQLWHTDLN